VAFCEPEHFERHVTDEPFCHEPGEIGKAGLGDLLRTTGQNPGRDRIVEELESRQESNNGTARHRATLAG
jgi:hypothetical protein